MILLIDVGNTRIKWGRLEEGELLAGGARPFVGDRLQEIAAALEGAARPEAVVAANGLGDEFGARLNAWSQRQWGVGVSFVVAESRALGITNAYTDPDRLGADRWLSLIAARRIVAGSVCTIDCGSALTVDVMDASGEHLGGLIIPGLAMMRRSLAQSAAGIDIDLGKVHAGEVSLFARDTEGGVMGGTLYALVAVIDRVVVDICEALGEDVSVLLTGGDAAVLRPLLSTTTRHEPDLVLKGLAAIAEERG